MEWIWDYIPWIAVCILSLGYWSQVWKIHIHKEVRDISMMSYIFLSVGFSIMAIKAHQEDSTIFLIKQIATLIPALIICFQIYIHKEDHWHDDDDEMCTNCGQELEPHWKFCAYCGHSASLPGEDNQANPST